MDSSSSSVGSSVGRNRNQGAPNQSNDLGSLLLMIAQDAAEKIEELEVSCEEEFKRLKENEINTRVEFVNEKYARKQVIVDKDNRASLSVLKNAARLKFLNAKDKLLREVIVETKSRFENQSEHTNKKLLNSLLLQALCRLMGNKVVVYCKTSDYNIVSRMIDEITTEYKSLTEIKSNITVDKKPLPQSCGGGIIIHSADGKTFVDNTLNKKVDDTALLLSPVIVEKLFNKHARIEAGPTVSV